MDKELFQGWLDRYIDAWRSYDPAAIGDLFTEDAEMRYHPYDPEPVRGRQAIVKDWLDNQDEPGSWRASYTALSVDRDIAVATGTSDYLTDDRSAVDRRYHNVFICRFDGDDRCSTFTEYFMQEPKKTGT
jgi:ketosteroid isomerase-like protein